jgi:chromosome segregation ATPase
LQQLHDEWAEIGPVARELREDLWERFKAASTVINKKHQAFFDEIHAKEQENLDSKRAIIEQLQALLAEMTAEDAKKDAKAWEEATQKVQQLQEAWRKIGFAPKKYNQSVYDEYRAECDKFFQAKKAFFQSLRERRKEWEQKHKEYLERQKAREERQREREEKMKKMVAKGGDNLRRMRDKLEQEIKTAENNILFFTAKSKTANKLVDDMQKKIEALKKQLADVKTQIDNADED